MSRSGATNRLAWSDRWSQPSLPQLLDPLKSHQRKIVNTLLDQLGQIEQTERSIIWYGPAWKWTIHYALIIPPSKGSKPADPSTLCYLVPKVEAPCICVPLSDEMIGHLPMTRLSRFIRDGIKMAKCAVAIHWACWTPGSQSEVAQIMELVKRRHKFALSPKPLAKK